MFSPSFDPEIYKKHKDLSEFSLEKLISHYKVHGKNEGRKASAIESRSDLVKVIQESGCKTLEIGPFDCPQVTGKNVKYLDVLSKEQLISRCKEIGRTNNIHNIPYIDYTDGLKTISEIFKFVVSCHSIEHQLSFVDHLNEVYNVLEDGGYYVLIVPDKRYCFDHFINETDLTELLQDHYTKKTNHSVKSLIEHRCYTTHNDCERHWLGDHGIMNVIQNKFSLKYTLQEYHSKKNSYIDVHNYQFTPDSFKEIFTKLVFLELTKFTIEEIYPTLRNSIEFFVVLKK
jgi:hypothetical protein